MESPPQVPLTMSPAGTLSIGICVDVHEDTVFFPKAAVLHTAAISRWAGIEGHDMPVGGIGWECRDPVTSLQKKSEKINDERQS